MLSGISKVDTTCFSLWSFNFYLTRLLPYRYAVFDCGARGNQLAKTLKSFFRALRNRKLRVGCCIAC